MMGSFRVCLSLLGMYTEAGNGRREGGMDGVI